MAQQQLARQYADLERAAAADESQRVLDIANAILSNHGEEVEARHAKAVAQLRLGLYTAAADSFGKLADKNAAITYSHAYALYRAGSGEAALKLLLSISSPSRSDLILIGQVQYKLEKYKDAVATFDKVLALTDKKDAEYAELLANANASRSLAGLALLGDASAQKGSYELAFNAAHVAVRDGDLAGASTLLEFAIEQCKATLTRDAASPEELADELAPILTQFAYVKQRMGRTEEALAMYETVLKSKTTDGASAAVASNNIVSIKQDHELFDSAKRLKSALGDATRPRLVSWQQRVLRFNNALLSLHMNKFAQARTQVDDMVAEDGSAAELGHLLRASIALREKKAGEALDELAPHVTSSTLLKLAQVQLLLSLQRYSEAVRILRDVALALPAKANVLGSAVCSLYEKVAEPSEAVAFVDAIKAQASSPDMVRFSAQFRLQLGDPRGAIADLEQVVANDKNDIESVAALVKACAGLDDAKASKYAEMLPRTAASAVDVDALENVTGRRGYKAKKRDDEGPSSTPTSPVLGSAAPPAKPKAKRKRKIRLPKNYDPANPGRPDPERWIPKNMRSSFRPKKKKNRDGPAKGGSQGSAPSAPPAGSFERNDPLDKSAASSSASPAQASSSSSGGGGKGKKKGKSRW